MRNLKLHHSLRIADSTELCGTRFLSIDYDTGVVYAASSTQVAALDPNTKQVIHQVSLIDDGYITGDGSIVGIQHLPDQMSTCIATSAGDVLLWNMAMAQVECMGSVESGIKCMAWSPDQELLVLLTGQRTLIIMTREFDPVTEVPIHSEEFGEAEPINVGWGKKETQFHGSEGKAAATKKKAEAKPASAWDDHQMRLSWRGDGQYFVISYIHPTSGARYLRTWTRDCVLHSTSQSMDGLEQALSWKPSGSLIASSQSIHNRHDIVFFERNGLQHGNFTLPFGINQVKVREVSWNIESTVLAVWCEERPSEGVSPEEFKPKSYVQLWTCGNYHWYLKQQLDFLPSSDDRVSCMTWDPENAYKLHIVCAGGQYSQYVWAWDTDCTQGRDQQDMATVAVIDGSKLLLTPMKNMIVPPPMCAFYLTLPAPVSSVSFAPPPHSNNLAVLAADGALHIYKYSVDGDKGKCDDVSIAAAGGTGFNVCCKTPSKLHRYSVAKLRDSGYPLSGSHLCWVRENVLLMFCLNSMGSQSVLHQYSIDDDELVLVHEVELEDYVYNVAVSSLSGTVALQLLDGTLLSYCPGEHSVMPFESNGSAVSFPIRCNQMAVTKVGGEEVALGLTDRFRFYVNDQQVASNCTSFAVHDEFLLLTTLSHTCRCISLNTSLKVLPTLSGDKSHPFDESVRRVERGSRIVHVVSDDTKLILQMPRGNLETVHPRALVLSVVRRLLDKLSFKEAFVLMRKHRLNMNLLYDHNPAVFMENVSHFIEQINSVNNINLFLTDLQEEDVTLTMYTGAYQERTNSASKNPGSKINRVCDAMLHQLQQLSSDKYLLSILTAHVKKTTPELEIALAKIQELKKHYDADRTVSAEEALKYLLFLVDVNELYDVALGTYDFELVVMVAEKSQKDPKEYLPFLNDLRRMEPNYQKFSIDRHLKRYKKALVNIAASGNQHFDECLTLVKEHKLYADALKLFKRDSNEYKEISVEYGHYLSSRGRETEAGLIYCKAGQLESALAAFESSCEWQHAVMVATQLNYSAKDMAELAKRIAEKLKEGRRHQEAAQLFEQYAEDIEEAIVTLINGHVWRDALRLMYKHSRTDFIESDLRPALVDAHESTLALLTSLRRDFEKYSNRLEVVREKKERERLELLEGGGTYNDADADLFSDASSATGESVQSGHSGKYSSTSSQRTGFSKISGRSGKARRKAERKRWSLKEGSRNEDLALIEALSKIIQQTEDIKKDLAGLLQALVLFDYDKEAGELQTALDDFIAVIEKTIPTIWDPLQEDMAATPVLGPESTAASIAQAVQSGRGMSQPQETRLDASLRVPPTMNKDFSWHLHVLKPQ